MIKGKVARDFFCSFNPIYVEDPLKTNFWFRPTIRRAGSIFYSGFNTFFEFYRISLNTFRAFEDFFLQQTGLTSTYSSYSLQYFLHIIR
jgi:hypothetical protein